MIIAHLADLHLGYRAYHRIASGGINVRERDVALALRAALSDVIERRPDLVLMAGDVFHTVRPPNAAIADAFHQLARLHAALPDTPVIVIAGNHDAPRSVETGSILRLLGEIPGVIVVEGDARRVHVQELDASVLCVPHTATSAGPIELEPDAAAGVNVLMLHGTVAGGAAEGKLRFLGDYGGASIPADAIRPERWDYVALGHYHIATELAKNMWYAGSLERCSTNIWEEATSPKGYVCWDTDTRTATFREIATRTVLDLPRVSARVSGSVSSGPASFLDAEQLDARVREVVESVPGGLEGKIVRLVLEELSRELFREMDHAQIRNWRAQALHFHLDVRRPEVSRTTGVGSPERHRTLEEELASFLRHWQPASPAIERDRLVKLGLRYLVEAGSRRDDEADLPPAVPA